MPRACASGELRASRRDHLNTWKSARPIHIRFHMPTPALSIKNLRKVYRRGNVAVEDLSLTIQEGDFFGFLGPNGAGKSTTIHCITGIANPTSGTIEVFGLDAV